MNTDQHDQEEGSELLARMWYTLAIKIVDLAIRTYQVPQEQASALRDVFLKPNDYYVSVRS
jgi:hypothetical protein